MKRRSMVAVLMAVLLFLSACDSPPVPEPDPDPIVYYRTHEILVTKERPVPVQREQEGQELYHSHARICWNDFLQKNQSGIATKNSVAAGQYALLLRGFLSEMQKKDERENRPLPFYEKNAAEYLSREAIREYNEGNYSVALGMMIELTGHSGASDFSSYWEDAPRRLPLNASVRAGDVVVLGSWRELPLLWRVEEVREGTARLESVFVVDQSTYRKNSAAPTIRESSETLYDEINRAFFESDGRVSFTAEEADLLTQRSRDLFLSHPEDKYWADSDLRSFLNTSFYEGAFTSEEKQLLVKSEINVKEMGEATWDFVAVSTEAVPFYASSDKKINPWFPSARQGQETDPGVWVCAPASLYRSSAAGNDTLIDSHLHCFVGLSGVPLSLRFYYDSGYCYWYRSFDLEVMKDRFSFGFFHPDASCINSFTGHPAEVHGVLPQITVSLG